jgi:DNA topoisomerase I
VAATRPTGPNVAAATDATSAGLRYVDSDEPGITRHPRGRGFEYRLVSGHRASDPATLQRIRALAIPPAWTEVWICASPNGHLQATGRDARGRKQYRYHARFRDRRDADKFTRIIRFGERLPRIRRRVTRDLSARGLPERKVIAAVVRLLELTLLRVGNDEYARLNQSFGLSTLRNRHARITGDRVRFRFRGKGGRMNEVGIADRRLAAVLRRCQSLPGQHLFEYVADDGEARRVDSDDVNAYIRDAAGDEAFSAKDVRTWAATVLAFRALHAAEPSTVAAEVKRTVTGAVEVAAERLGNTPTVARASYVHPAVLETYLGGDPLVRGRGISLRHVATSSPPTPAEEAAVLRLLRGPAPDRPSRTRR